MTAAWLRRGAWRWAHLVLLVALWQGFGLALLDHDAAERDPLHTHLVLGASGPERAEALVAYHRASLLPHTHDPSTGQPLPIGTGYGPRTSTVRAVALNNSVGLGPSVFDLAGQTLPAPTWRVPLAGPGQGQRLFPLTTPLPGVALPVPDPPPRG